MRSYADSWAGPGTQGAQIDDHGDVLVAAATVPPDLFVNPIAVTPSKRCGSSRWPSVRTTSLAVFHDTPSPSATRAMVRCWHTTTSNAHRRPRRDGLARGSAALTDVLAPYMSTASAPVTADRDQQRGRPRPEGFIGQLEGHAVSRGALLTAAPTPGVVLGKPACQHRTIGLQASACHLRSKFIKAAESRQVWAAEAVHRRSGGHVEVFQIRRVGTFILGRPRPLHRQRRADQHYTPDCREPLIRQRRGESSFLSLSVGTRQTGHLYAKILMRT